jgi:hypothetical protein
MLFSFTSTFTFLRLSTTSFMRTFVFQTSSHGFSLCIKGYSLSLLPYMSSQSSASVNTLEADMSFLGLTNVLASSPAVDYSEVLADIEGEQETVPDLTSGDFEPQEGSNDGVGLPSQWEEAISSVGKGVTDGTHREYIRSVYF